MQIHELTQTQVVEGLGDTIGGLAGRAKAGINRGVQAATSPWQSAKAAYKKPVQNQQTQMLANKAFGIWQNYAQRLRDSVKDPAKLTAFDNRTDGTFEKALLAFTQKNLLGGAYLPNLTNKDEILELVKEISAPGVTPEQEKELFAQLVTQGTLAQNIATGTGSQAQSAGGSTGNQLTTGQQTGSDAHSMVAGIQQVLASPAGGQISPNQLRHIGTVVTSGFAGTPTINSTGNPGVDALLLAMGFTGI